MPKQRSKFTCQQCGYISPSFLGRCPECSEWNSFVESIEGSKRSTSKFQVPTASKESAKPIQLKDIKVDFSKRIPTGIGELDHVLSGGLVGGQVVLLAGEPGVGKSTLLLQLVQESMSKVKGRISNVLYISGEESPAQIGLRAKRLGLKASTSLTLLAETNVDHAISYITKGNSPSLVIIDSIQTMWSEDLTGAPGSVGQVRECAYKLIQIAKHMGVPMIIVGQVTKEGSIAGPKVLEHLVDTVLSMDGGRHEEHRMVRVMKNRYGPTDEVAVFTMGEKGLIEVANPSAAFVSDRTEDLPGSSNVIVLEGSRPLAVEVQALVSHSDLNNPRRVANGIPFSRLLMITAIVGKHLSLPLENYDVYVNVSGGFRIEEPGADLGLALAIISSFKSKALPRSSVAIGELSLLGEVQMATQYARRVKEAKKLGFKHIYSHKTSTRLVDFIKGKK